MESRRDWLRGGAIGRTTSGRPEHFLSHHVDRLGPGGSPGRSGRYQNELGPGPGPGRDDPAVVASAHARAFGLLFTNDEAFLDMWEECWWPFLATLVLMNLAVALERIPYSMGRTVAVFRVSLVASWLGQVPGVILLTRYWRDDLVG